MKSWSEMKKDFLKLVAENSAASAPDDCNLNSAFEVFLNEECKTENMIMLQYVYHPDFNMIDRSQTLREDAEFILECLGVTMKLLATGEIAVINDNFKSTLYLELGRNGISYTIETEMLSNNHTISKVDVLAHLFNLKDADDCDYSEDLAMLFTERELDDLFSIIHNINS